MDMYNKGIITLVFIAILAGIVWFAGSMKNSSPATVQYKNDQYGFTFDLPSSWNGYSIVTDSWKGYSPNSSIEAPTETGPLISIRHPLWSTDVPRQDIPIMVMTIDQWNALTQEKFHIGAAPIGPRELGRNSRYVFALPARYNYAFPAGFEEVDSILNGNPLHAF